MNETFYAFHLAMFKQEQLEKAAREERRAREAREAGNQESARVIKLKRGLSLRRILAWLS